MDAQGRSDETPPVGQTHPPPIAKGIQEARPPASSPTPHLRYTDGDADVRLSASDNVVFMLHSYQLQAVSPILASILDRARASLKPPYPLAWTDEAFETSSSIATYFDAIYGRPLDPSTSNGINGIANAVLLSRKYQSPSVTDTLLLSLRSAASANVLNPLLIFRAASKISEWDICAKAMINGNTGWTWNEPGYNATLDKNQDRASVFAVFGWRVVDFEYLPRRVVLALLRSGFRALKDNYSKTNVDWAAASAEFVRLMRYPPAVKTGQGDNLGLIESQGAATGSSSSTNGNNNTTAGRTSLLGRIRQLSTSRPTPPPASSSSSSTDTKSPNPLRRMMSTQSSASLPPPPYAEASSAAPSEAAAAPPGLSGLAFTQAETREKAPVAFSGGSGERFALVSTDGKRFEMQRFQLMAASPRFRVIIAEDESCSSPRTAFTFPAFQSEIASSAPVALAISVLSGQTLQTPTYASLSTLGHAFRLLKAYDCAAATQKVRLFLSEVSAQRARCPFDIFLLAAELNELDICYSALRNGKGWRWNPPPVPPVSQTRVVPYYCYDASDKTGGAGSHKPAYDYSKGVGLPPNLRLEDRIRDKYVFDLSALPLGEFERLPTAMLLALGRSSEMSLIGTGPNVDWDRLSKSVKSYFDASRAAKMVDAKGKTFAEVYGA